MWSQFQRKSDILTVFPEPQRIHKGVFLEATKGAARRNVSTA